MGRAPCCDKVGLKKGPWTPEEDQILISFIHQHGHSNWRALPKQAGLLRCGKSCRLRWINYLRPDIKRGNFTKEEEDMIIQLHEVMGNRWSAIAGKLPGRTDNEIKNVWHTHIKKRLKQHQTTTKPKDHITKSTTTTNNFPETSGGIIDQMPTSPQQSYTSNDFSSITDVSSTEIIPNNTEQILDTQQSYSLDDYLPIIDDTFWSEEDFSSNNVSTSDMTSMFSNIMDDDKFQFLAENSELFNNFSSAHDENCLIDGANNSMDFWFDVFVRAGEEPEF